MSSPLATPTRKSGSSRSARTQMSTEPQLKEYAFNKFGWAMRDNRVRNGLEVIRAFKKSSLDAHGTPGIAELKQIPLYRESLEFTEEELETDSLQRVHSTETARYLVVGYTTMNILKTIPKNHTSDSPYTKKAPGYKQQSPFGIEAPHADAIVPWIEDHTKPEDMILYVVQDLADVKNFQPYVLVMPSNGLCNVYRCNSYNVFIRHEFRDDGTELNMRTANWGKIIIGEIDKYLDRNGMGEMRRSRRAENLGTIQDTPDDSLHSDLTMMVYAGRADESAHKFTAEQLTGLIQRVVTDMNQQPLPNTQALEAFRRLNQEGDVSWSEELAEKSMNEAKRLWPHIKGMTPERMDKAKKLLDLCIESSPAKEPLPVFYLDGFIAQCMFAFSEKDVNIGIENGHGAAICQYNIEMIKRVKGPIPPRSLSVIPPSQELSLNAVKAKLQEAPTTPRAYLKT